MLKLFCKDLIQLDAILPKFSLESKTMPSFKTLTKHFPHIGPTPLGKTAVKNISTTTRNQRVKKGL